MNSTLNTGFVLTKDIVNYQPALGVPGRVTNALLIRNTLSKILEFSDKAPGKIYPL
jgi:hypothetical protein